MTVPYAFSAATSAIPLSQLDANFNTPITLGNTAIQLGNTVTTLNNMTLANVTISSGNVTITNVTVTTANVTTVNATTVIATTANVTTGNVTNLVSGNVSLTGGSITGTPISGSTGSFTTLTTSSTVTLNGGTAGGVAYLDGSKVLTTGSALTFDGTNFVLGTGGTSGGFPFTQRVSASASPVNAYRITNGSDATFDVTLQTSLVSFGTGIGDLAFLRQGSEQMRLTSTGLGIGTSSPQSRLEARQDQSGAITRVIVNNNTAANGSGGAFDYYFGTTRLGGITHAFSTSAYMAFDVWSGSAATERMRLDSSGNLGLGVTPSAWDSSSKVMQFGGGSIWSFSTSQVNLLQNAFYNTSGNFIYVNTAAASAYRQISGAHSWYTAASGTAGNAITFTQAMTLDGNGALLVGQTSWAFANNGTQIAASGRIFNTSNTDYNMELAGSQGGRLRFYTSAGGSATTVGSITVDTTNTQYNTSSDYRLKNITGPITNSGAYIDSLKPVEGTWKIDGSTFVGLLAHEAQEVSRTKVATGVKDGPDMQGMAYSSAEIIANLIAELQSLRKRVAQLEGA